MLNYYAKRALIGAKSSAVVQAVHVAFAENLPSNCHIDMGPLASNCNMDMGLVLLHSVNEGVSAAAVHVHASPGVLDVALALGALMIPLLLRQLQEPEVLRSPLVFWQSLELCALHVRVGRLAVPAQPHAAAWTAKSAVARAGMSIQVDEGRAVSGGTRKTMLNISFVSTNTQEISNMTYQYILLVTVFSFNALA
jgi:hypothetical protein